MTSLITLYESRKYKKNGIYAEYEAFITRIIVIICKKYLTREMRLLMNFTRRKI